MYRYSQVEAALMKLSRLNEAYRIALRARVKHFQRLGLTPKAPGGGARISYDFNDVALLALCFELAQYSIDPTRIALMSKWLWPLVSKVIGDKPTRRDAIFLALPAYLNRTAVEYQLESGPTGQGLFPIDYDGSSEQMIFTAAEASNVKRPRRVLEINLDDLRSAIVAALDEVVGQRTSAI